MAPDLEKAGRFISNFSVLGFILIIPGITLTATTDWSSPDVNRTGPIILGVAAAILLITIPCQIFYKKKDNSTENHAVRRNQVATHHQTSQPAVPKPVTRFPPPPAYGSPECSSSFSTQYSSAGVHYQPGPGGRAVGPPYPQEMPPPYSESDVAYPPMNAAAYPPPPRY